VGLVGRFFVRETEQASAVQVGVNFFTSLFLVFCFSPREALDARSAARMLDKCRPWLSHLVRALVPEHCSHISSYNGNVNGMETLRCSDFVKTQKLSRLENWPGKLGNKRAAPVAEFQQKQGLGLKWDRVKKLHALLDGIRYHCIRSNFVLF
jgi:hypothetical protein